jgi:hypothetical protein
LSAGASLLPYERWSYLRGAARAIIDGRIAGGRYGIKEKSMRYGTSVLTFCILLSFCVCTIAQQDKPSGQNKDRLNELTEAVIRGQVVDPQGKGVAGVRVRCFELANEDFQEERCRIYTDPRGQ